MSLRLPDLTKSHWKVSDHVRVCLEYNTTDAFLYVEKYVDYTDQHTARGAAPSRGRWQQVAASMRRHWLYPPDADAAELRLRAEVETMVNGAWQLFV